jgi:hypothetical protein
MTGAKTCPSTAIYTMSRQPFRNPTPGSRNSGARASRARTSGLRLTPSQSKYRRATHGSDSLDSLRALDAPPEARREHEELVVAANNYVHELDAFIGQLQSAQTVDDVQSLFENIPGSPLDEAASRLDTSCLQLQDVATARSIDVDLDCGD